MSTLTSGAACEKVDKAKTKLEEVKKFRDEIVYDVAELQNASEALRNKITKHVQGKKNIDGCLTHTTEAYLGCFGTLDNLLFQALLNEDIQHWESVSRGTQKLQDNFKNKIDSFLRDQSEKLEELLFTSTLLANATLTKLPILSTVHKGGKIDFEWPTQPEMKEMLKTQMVKLSKIEIWYYQDYNFMTGIRATLSNGARSPIFRTAGE